MVKPSVNVAAYVIEFLDRCVRCTGQQFMHHRQLARNSITYAATFSKGFTITTYRCIISYHFNYI